MGRSVIVLFVFLFVSLCILEIYAKKIEIPLVRKHHKNHPEFLHKRTATSVFYPTFPISSNFLLNYKCRVNCQWKGARRRLENIISTLQLEHLLKLSLLNVSFYNSSLFLFLYFNERQR